MSSKAATAAAAAEKEYEDCLALRKRQIEWTSHVLRVARQRQQRRNTATAAAVDVVDDFYSLRGLYPSERQALLDTGCRSSSPPPLLEDLLLGSVRLLLPTDLAEVDQSQLLSQRVSNNTFASTTTTASALAGNNSAVVVLVVDKNKDDEFVDYDNDFLVGIHSNRIGGACILSVNASICDNSWIARTYVGPHAVVRNCGQVSSSNDTSGTSCCWNTPCASNIFLELDVGPESGGGRKLRVSVESDMRHVCQQLVNIERGQEQRRGSDASDKKVENQQNDNDNVANIFCRRSLVRNTPTVHNVFLYPHARIQAATSVQDAVLYPHSYINNASIVQHALLQWNASIVHASYVSHALVMEASQVGPSSATVAHSVLGPDVHVSCGEVHSSILGANTNAHHQSLLISVHWPLGRGNVGYGAKVGSNHTGRLPDQETVAGEGTFFGLGCVVKFPVNWQEAPYSVLAAGTTLPPQRLRMPFSLLLTSTTNSSRNTLLPGWVLQSSPYTLARSASKFDQRQKARHHVHYTKWKIVRPETVDLCVRARRALLLLNKGSTGTGAAATKTVYFGDKDILGIGPNELSEKGRRDGIDAYTECIQRFALQGLLAFLAESSSGSSSSRCNMVRKLETLLSAPVEERCCSKTTTDEEEDGVVVQWNTFPWQVDETKLWEYQQTLLRNEFPLPPTTNTTRSSSDDKDAVLVVSWVRDLLDRLVKLEHKYARQVYKCKQRDDTRGAQTIPGYKDSHLSADGDPVIAQVRADAAETEQKVMQLLVLLAEPYNPSYQHHLQTTSKL